MMVNDSNLCSDYEISIRVPASFVTPILSEIRKYIENKSDWKDTENVSKLVDRIISYEKMPSDSHIIDRFLSGEKLID